MPQQSLIPCDFLSDTPPDIEYSGDDDVVSWLFCEDNLIVVEIVKRSDKFFSLRYQAWVDWHDAGGSVQSRSWHVVQTGDGVIVDEFATATEIAEESIRKFGLSRAGGWHTAT